MATELTLKKLSEMRAKAQTEEELDAIKEMGDFILKQRLADAINDFASSSIQFVDVSARILNHIKEIQSKTKKKAPGLEALFDEFAELHRKMHESAAMGKTEGPDAPSQPTVIINDEEDLEPAKEPEPLTPGPRPEPPLETPRPLSSKKFEELADEYTTFFLRSVIRPEREHKVRAYAEQAGRFKSRYDAVAKDLNIPWWFIAGVHLLESTFNFNTHLHNGDPLSGRTKRIPKNRPSSGSPPFTWEASAKDALRLQKLADLTDWSLPRALWRWERYNGFGYRSRGVPTPYLWSFSTIYKRGKFVADGVFSETAVSEQCGAAVLLKALHEAGTVDLKLDLVADNELNQPDSDGDAQRVVDGNLPNIDDSVPAGHPFEAFFARNLPHIKHFKWHEFLVKGGSHAANGLNTDPPEELWPNVVRLVNVLDKFREAVGKSVVLTSVYRSKAYNRAIGGAERSQHTAFCAADFKIPGSTNTGDWANKLKSMRNQGVFEGGIGIYNTFVHVDCRGYRADWDRRS